MDFEERLETTERSDSPSLVGASIRSADDSIHNNYIHPEKYKTSKSKDKSKNRYKSLTSQVNASLDDLIKEGALITSEEYFDEKYLQGSEQDKKEEDKSDSDDETLKKQEIDQLKNDFKSNQKKEIQKSIKESEPLKDVNEESKPKVTKGNFYKQEDYSTPNLSEYQLDNDIKDHSNFLESVKSHDYHKLPHSKIFEDNNESKPLVTPSPIQQQRERERENPNLNPTYFYTECARSRSRSANPPTNRKQDRSSSGSSINSSNPHLARGDTYKNIHSEEPTKYELPANLEVAKELENEEDDNDDRRGRHTKPTMGESIAKIEAEKENGLHDTPLTRDPSLITTGDYTNFEADSPRIELTNTNNLYATRSESSKNYLRSISRSRSRVRQYGEKEVNAGYTLDEKNDANTDTLVEEGALVSDDPLSNFDKLENMIDEILHVDENKEAKDNTSQTKQTGVQIEKDEDIKNEEKQVKENAKYEDKEESKSDDKSESVEEATNKEESKSEDKEVQEDVNTKDVKEIDLESEEKSKDNLITEPDNEEPETEEADLVKPEETSAPVKGLEDIEPALNQELSTKEEDKEEEPKELTSKSTERTTHESLVEEDAIIQKNNQKDNANSDDIVNVNPLENVDQENLEKEGIATESKDTSNKEEDTETDLKDVQEIAEKNEKVKTLLTGETSTKNEKEEDPEEYKEIKKADPLDTELKEEAAEEEKKDEEVPLASVDDKEAPIVKDPKEEQEQSTKEEDKPQEIDSKEEKIKSKEEEKIDKDLKEEQETKKAEFKHEKSTAKASTSRDDDLDDLEISPEELRKHLESQPVYIYTSLAGGMQIMPRTNRLATILQANGIKFEYKDLGTDEEAKKIWKRQSNGKTLPGVIRGDDFIGNWQEIDDANEEYRIRELIYETL
ncbi:unnamed protein product [Candida verbasci]|uniref:Uncharacterized protein n=1 Tax=Candida verbasci TaxID=1227364 RepID=A0A9W4U0X0_9ASCO|nr:unnamed protein product [Candida verbasci]